MSKGTCKTCDHCDPNTEDSSGQTGICVEAPPQMLVVLQQHPISGQMQQMITARQSPVSLTTRCARYKLRAPLALAGANNG